MKRLTLLTRKVRDAVVFDLALAHSTELTRSERARFAVRRYAAIAADRRSIAYLGKTFSYDNRLTPALLPAYLQEIRRLDDVVGFAAAQSVIDVGANIGQFAATLSWRFPHLAVWSFEPNGEVIGLLRENARQSSRWHVAPFGIANRDAQAELWFVPGKSSQGSVYRGNASAGLAHAEAVAIPARFRELDAATADALSMPRSVDLVKVDVEGAEISALEGLAHVRWRYLALETSVGREGGLTLDQSLDAIERIWGVRARVRWAASPRRGETARDVILAAA